MNRVNKVITDKRMKVDVLVPGFTLEELKVVSRKHSKEENPVVIVKGKPSKKKTYGYKKEVFKETFSVGPDFDVETLSVGLSLGVLTLSIERTEESLGKIVEITENSANEATDEEVE